MGSDNNEIILPELFQLEHISDLHESLSDHHDNTIVIDGSNVSKVDTSGLQLLVAIKKELDQVSGSLQLKSISEPLKQAIETMGLHDELSSESHS